MTPRTKEGVMVVYMLLSAVGSGQVRKNLNHELTKRLTETNGKTLQTTTVAAQASVPRKDMSVVTAFRNVSVDFTEKRRINSNTI
jgi:hypothetical protein